jgi:transcriptional regulator with XRE-family HTH domain
MRRKQLSQQLKEFIDNAGMTRRDICERVGLDETTMSHFFAGRTGLNMRTVDAIGELLELDLTARKGRTVQRGESVK